MTKVWLPAEKWKRKGGNVSKRIKIAKAKKKTVVSPKKARASK